MGIVSACTVCDMSDRGVMMNEIAERMGIHCSCCEAWNRNRG